MNLFRLFFECLYTKYTQVGSSANYAVKRENDTLYLFFQDSEGAEDWKVNFDFQTKPYKRMGNTVWFAHRGFLKLWKTTEPLLTKYILNSKIKKIVIIGYSHGAAIALLCHEYVWYNRPDLRDTIEGYGFACPRVIGGKSDKSVWKRWERFTVIRNLNDIVTQLPRQFLGYCHVGKMLEIGKSGKYSLVGAHRPENMLKEITAYELKEFLLSKRENEAQKYFFVYKRNFCI